MRRRRWLYWQGDPGVLVFGLDYRGNLCGKDNDGGLDLESYDYRYWPNTQEMAALGSIQIMDAKSICLKGCPKPAEADESGAVTSVKWVCDYPDDGTPPPATRAHACHEMCKLSGGLGCFVASKPPIAVAERIRLSKREPSLSRWERKSAACVWWHGAGCWCELTMRSARLVVCTGRSRGWHDDAAVERRVLRLLRSIERHLQGVVQGVQGAVLPYVPPPTPLPSLPFPNPNFPRSVVLLLSDAPTLFVLASCVKAVWHHSMVGYPHTHLSHTHTHTHTHIADSDSRRREGARCSGGDEVHLRVLELPVHGRLR